MSAIALLCGGLLLSAALAVGLAGSLAGTAPAAEAAPRAAAVPQAGGVPQAARATLTAAGSGGSLQACVAYAYTAIKQHKVVTATPAACKGLSRARVNQAAIIAIRMTMTRGGTKAVRRKQEGTAAQWVLAMITSPAPATETPLASSTTVPPSAAGPAGGLGLGGVSELAAKVGALLAWLATATSGGWVLARWLLAGGSPLRRTTTAAPPAVILGHAGAGALGLALWTCFTLSGWAALAWIALGVLAPVSGLGMGVLLLGLPGPVRSDIGARGPGRRARVPVLVIVAHGLFAVTTLLLVLMAAIGAG
jgi:hypothetical protein